MLPPIQRRLHQNAHFQVSLPIEAKRRATLIALARPPGSLDASCGYGRLPMHSGSASACRKCVRRQPCCQPSEASCSIQRGGQGAPRPRVAAQRCYRLTTETLTNSKNRETSAPVSASEGPVNVMTITCRPLNTNRAARTKTLSKMGTSATTWRAGYPFVIKRRSLRSCDLLLRLTSHLMVVSRAVSRMLLALAFLIWSGGRST